MKDEQKYMFTIRFQFSTTDDVEARRIAQALSASMRLNDPPTVFGIPMSEGLEVKLQQLSPNGPPEKVDFDLKNLPEITQVGF